ncbi:MAG: hypothetical protein EAZ37_08565 [Burkholderiales bacterium]|nr:MAG: hypothetical protein EAZ37_08565 [Burkholderiales bacterium]
MLAGNQKFECEDLGEPSALGLFPSANVLRAGLRLALPLYFAARNNPITDSAEKVKREELERRFFANRIGHEVEAL